MTRTHTQVKIGDIVPPITIGRTYVTIATDIQTEPDKETTPEGYYEASYIAVEILKSEWDKTRASGDDVELAEARSLTNAFELYMELTGGV